MALGVFSTNANAQSDLQTALAQSQMIGFVKAMAIHDDKKGGRLDQDTLGVGGKIGVQTGDWQGFTVKAAWYTTDDLGLRQSDPRQTDAYMFDINKKPYSLWGEAQLQSQFGKTSVIAGRQEFFSPVINTYEFRIIPNLFEAVTVKNRDITDSTLTFAYVSKMSGLDGLLDYSTFRSMSQQTYTSLKVDNNQKLSTAGETIDPATVVGHQGVWVAGWVYEQKHRVQLWNYYSHNNLNTVYGDVRWHQPISKDFSGTLEAQAYQVNSIGQFKSFLAQQGLNGDYALLGLKGSLAHRPSGITTALAFTRYSGDENTVTAYGNWGGYPEYIIMPYLYAENNQANAIARSQLSRLTVVFDLSKIGLKGQSLLLGHARVNLDDRILANSDIVVNALVYRAQITPKWSARFTVDSRNSQNTRYDNEFVTLGLRYDF